MKTITLNRVHITDGFYGLLSVAKEIIDSGFKAKRMQLINVLVFRVVDNNKIALAMINEMVKQDLLQKIKEGKNTYYNLTKKSCDMIREYNAKYEQAIKEER